MSTQIVVVNVNEQLAPLPATLQQNGAFISQGGTTLAAGTYMALPQPTTLATILSAPIPLASITVSGKTATATTVSTTIASGTYDPSTGDVNLTLTEDIGLVVGSTVVISSATGTGDFADINGAQTCISGTGGGTVNFTIAESLTMTITGGDAAYGLGGSSVTWWTAIAGASPAAYNGTVYATQQSSTTFSYPIANGTPSPATGSPTYTARNVGELIQMNNTWWAQSNAMNLAPYVLELGPITNALAITALQAYITANPSSAYTPGAQGFFYSYLVPRNWYNATGIQAMIANYSNPTAQVRFFATLTLGSFATFPNTSSALVGLVEAPQIGNAEFSIAAPFFVTLNYNPTTTNKVPPLNNAFVYGVTPWLPAGNQAQLEAFQAAGANWIGTGAQGGLTNTTFVYGTTGALQSFNFGYAVDWAQITTSIAVANAVINGSNSTSNPLYYNQEGINTLQSVAANNLQSGISSGLILGSLILTELDTATFLQNVNAGAYAGNCVINAVPFTDWVSANPDDYGEGLYGGFTVLMTPQLGFTQVVFNLNITEFA